MYITRKHGCGLTDAMKDWLVPIVPAEPAPSKRLSHVLCTSIATSIILFHDSSLQISDLMTNFSRPVRTQSIHTWAADFTWVVSVFYCRKKGTFFGKSLVVPLDRTGTPPGIAPAPKSHWNRPGSQIIRGANRIVISEVSVLCWSNSAL